MVQTLRISGGEHILISAKLIGKSLNSATDAEINEEKRKFMAVCFTLGSDPQTYKKLLNDLRSLVNRGRDKYLETVTDVFDLLVRDSGEYDSIALPTNMYRRRRGPRGRGHQSYMFSQQDGRGGTCIYTRTNNNSSTKIVAAADGVKHNEITCYGYNFLGHYQNQYLYQS